MADISNILLNTVKAKYVCIYILLAWSNLLFLVIMMIRMILMMIMTVIGFIIVVLYVIKRDEMPINSYKVWLKIYFSLSVFQILLAVVFTIIMKTIF